MTIEQRVAVLEEIFAKLRDYYILLYSGEEIDALLASAGVPIGITKEYDSVSAMNDDFSSTDVTRGQFVLILTTDTSSEDYGKVYLKGSANWVYVFTLTSLTAIKGPQGPAGKTGAKGADGADGKNFMVLGYYETLSALNAAVPSPGTGDTYGVGTEPPYAFYMYDPTISNWRYVGNLQGPAGPTGGEDNFVRYDASQALTDAQKTQARGNIAAAPDGYGLGSDSKWLTPDDNLDTLMKNGWFQYERSNPPQGALPTALSPFATLVRVSVAGNACVQEAFAPTDSASHGSVLRRTIYGSTVYPWEWVNPPFTGDEYTTYLTTERRNGGVSVQKATIGDFEVWNAGGTAGDSPPFWPSLGKSVGYAVDAGGTRSIALPHDRTFFFSVSDNVRRGVAIVQTSGGTVGSVTALVPLQNWKIEIGTGLTVNVSELGGNYNMNVYILMI